MEAWLISMDWRIGNIKPPFHAAHPFVHISCGDDYGPTGMGDGDWTHHSLAVTS